MFVVSGPTYENVYEDEWCGSHVHVINTPRLKNHSMLPVTPDH